MNKKVNELRKKFKKYNIDGYIVSKNDDYFTEYSKINRLEIISNFTGSAGLAIILKNKNYLFTDGRYTIQSQIESGKDFKIINYDKIIDFDLVKKGETFIIKECPSSESELTSLIRESNGNKTVLAILKVGKRWNLVRDILKKEDIINKSFIALNVGMSDQIIQFASQYKKDFMPYFSLILIRFD